MLYYNKIFIFAILKRWLIHFNGTECSFVYLMSNNIHNNNNNKNNFQ